MTSLDVTADAAEDGRWHDWKWMKSYRVWQANRLVFLYPENWIEPELRDDKSPFFKDLENDLGLQLLERNRNRVALTDVGAVFLKEAKQVLARAEWTDPGIAEASTD